ncbi:MAG: DUF72 domain-containing protein [Chloroflexota bacterium]|nr:DUF72 domain-containing protein [Chloroflexota bacterium]
MGQALRDVLSGRLHAKGQVYLRDLPQTVQMGVWGLFREALQPLQRAGKLGLVLFQFADSLMPGLDSQAYILFCKAQLPHVRIGVEFRNGLWLDEGHMERTLKFLQEHGFVLVCVDEPQGFTTSVPPIAEATSDQAYVRFHGRNREKWERKGGAPWEQFDYCYRKEELQEWVPKLRALQDKAQVTHVIFGARHHDQGIANARQLEALLNILP